MPTIDRDLQQEYWSSIPVEVLTQRVSTFQSMFNVSHEQAMIEIAELLADEELLRVN
jgi:hypothetical protein